jgi:hypothetical protein
MGFEATIPVFEREKSFHAVYREATVIDTNSGIVNENVDSVATAT